LERIAAAPYYPLFSGALSRFPPEEVASIANRSLGKTSDRFLFSEYGFWLLENSKYLDTYYLFEKLKNWESLTPMQISELVILSHAFCPSRMLVDLASNTELYKTQQSDGTPLGVAALVGLSIRRPSSFGSEAAFLQSLRAITQWEEFGKTEDYMFLAVIPRLFKRRGLPRDETTWPEFASLARLLVKRLALAKNRDAHEDLMPLINSWADKIEAAIAEKAKRKKKPETKSPRKRTAKKAAKGGRKR